MSNFFDTSSSLRLKPFESSAADILDELASGSAEKIDSFLIDPSGYLLSKLDPGVIAQLPRNSLNSANRFLYSAISNPEFREWLDAYDVKLATMVDEDEFSEIDDSKIRSDVAEALSRFADPEIMEALIESPPQPHLFPRPNDPKGLPPSFPLRPDPTTAISPGIAVVVWAVIAVTVAAVALAVIGAKAGRDSFHSERIGRFRLSGQGMANIADMMVEYAERLREAGKL